MKPGKYKYPFCECSHHPGPQKSYCVCKHVMHEGAEPIVDELASDEDPGVIVCSDELHKSQPKADYFVLVCEGCVVDSGLLLGERNTRLIT